MFKYLSTKIFVTTAVLNLAGVALIASFSASLIAKNLHQELCDYHQTQANRLREVFGSAFRSAVSVETTLLQSEEVKKYYYTSNLLMLNSELHEIDNSSDYVFFDSQGQPISQHGKSLAEALPGWMLGKPYVESFRNPNVPQLTWFLGGTREKPKPLAMVTVFHVDYFDTPIGGLSLSLDFEKLFDEIARDNEKLHFAIAVKIKNFGYWILDRNHGSRLYGLNEVHQKASGLIEFPDGSYSYATADIKDSPFELLSIQRTTIAQEIAWHAILTVLLLTAAVFLVIALLLRLLINRMLDPLKEVQATFASVASGNLDVAVPVRGSDELAQLAESFNKMTVDLKELQKKLQHSTKLVAIGELAAGIAHEVNNPLAIIVGYVDVLRKELEAANNAAWVKKFESIDKAIRRIANIVKGFRDFARVDDTKAAAIDLHEAVGEAITLVEPIFRKDGVMIKTSFTRGKPAIIGHAGRIQQVVVNLLANAKDALMAKGGGEISISTESDGERVSLFFADNGCGIPKEAMDRIFKPFFTTKAAGRGTGLGLSIVQSTIEGMNGHISVESTADVGTTFKITLPVVESRAITAEPKVERVNKRLQLSGKALVVEDEEELSAQLKAVLERTGLKVNVAGDGEAALILLRQESFDYILTDLKMPRMGGEAMIEKARSADLVKNAKVIILTGGLLWDHTTEEQNKLIREVDGFLQKPFSPQELYAVLKGDKTSR